MFIQSALSFDFKSRSFYTSLSQLINVEEKNSTTYMNKSFADNWSNCIKKLSEDRDVHAFRELFNYFSPRIKSFLLKSGGSVSQAEECMQEAMASVWQKAHMFDPTKASAATWIFTIARSKQ